MPFILEIAGASASISNLIIKRTDDPEDSIVASYVFKFIGNISLCRVNATQQENKMKIIIQTTEKKA